MSLPLSSDRCLALRSSTAFVDSAPALMCQLVRRYTRGIRVPSLVPPQWAGQCMHIRSSVYCALHGLTNERKRRTAEEVTEPVSSRFVRHSRSALSCCLSGERDRRRARGARAWRVCDHVPARVPLRLQRRVCHSRQPLTAVSFAGAIAEAAALCGVRWVYSEYTV